MVNLVINCITRFEVANEVKIVQYDFGKITMHSDLKA